MLIRFLDKNGRCFQIDNHKTPILIFCESGRELDELQSAKTGDCIMSIPATMKACDIVGACEKLNTKDEPIQMR
jgi:hypothetical protein